MYVYTVYDRSVAYMVISSDIQHFSDYRKNIKTFVRFALKLPKPGPQRKVSVMVHPCESYKVIFSQTTFVIS